MALIKITSKNIKISATKKIVHTVISSKKKIKIK
jgi:hypothetical protein|tara:strand:- start:1621 stop:1722 length:102 start_codon:yes stop_codon:yes gene_type:complete